MCVCVSPPNPTPVWVYVHVTPQTQRIKLHLLPTPPAATPAEPARLPGQGLRGLKAAAPACHAPAATAGAPRRSGSRVAAPQAARRHCAASQGRGFPLRAPLCHLKRNVALKYKLRCSLSCFGQLKAAWQAGAGGRLQNLSCCGMEPLCLIYFFLRKKNTSSDSRDVPRLSCSRGCSLAEVLCGQQAERPRGPRVTQLLLKH